MEGLRGFLQHGVLYFHTFIPLNLEDRGLVSRPLRSGTVDRHEHNGHLLQKETRSTIVNGRQIPIWQLQHQVQFLKWLSHHAINNGMALA